MKAFTDLEQSKKLAKILPIYSADMFYTSLNRDYPWIWIDKHLMEVDDIPCWSLTALLELMPIETHLYKMQDEDNYTKHYYKVGSFDGKGWIELNNTSAIDAVYDMVCWLKENKKI